MRLYHIANFSMLVIALGVGGCSGGVSNAVEKRYGQLIETTYNDQSGQPLCIEAGPFPYESRGRGRCDRCEDLLAAGLLKREVMQEADLSFVRFELTESGTAHYRDDIDHDQLASVRRQMAARGDQRDPPDPEVFAKPRFCFGKERFHHITEALGPMDMGGVTFVSVKIVVEVTDASPLLWDPQLAPLKFRLPPKPKDGQPILHVPRVETFRVMPGGKNADMDNLRYGRWVNER